VSEFKQTPLVAVPSSFSPHLDVTEFKPDSRAGFAGDPLHEPRLSTAPPSFLGRVESVVRISLAATRCAIGTGINRNALYLQQGSG